MPKHDNKYTAPLEQNQHQTAASWILQFHRVTTRGHCAPIPYLTIIKFFSVHWQEFSVSLVHRHYTFSTCRAHAEVRSLSFTKLTLNTAHSDFISRSSINIFKYFNCWQKNKHKKKKRSFRIKRSSRLPESTC